MKYPSRNKPRKYDDNPTEVECPLCGYTFPTTQDNTQCVSHTQTYWCDRCGEQFVQGMKCFDYKYTNKCKKKDIEWK